MAIGKLYSSDGEHCVINVEYQLQSEESTRWWGELIPNQHEQISDVGTYVIELDDERTGTCYLRKMVNRAVSGVPPRYMYRFTGKGTLSLPAPLTSVEN